MHWKTMRVKCISNRFPPAHLIVSPLSGDFHRVFPIYLHSVLLFIHLVETAEISVLGTGQLPPSW